MTGSYQVLRCTRHLARTIAAAAATLVLFSPASAQGPGWTANGKVIRIVNTNNGGFNVRLSPDIIGCTSKSNYGPHFASVYPNHPGIDRIKADLLAAYIAGETVSLYLTDSTCTVGETLLGGW